MLLFAHWLPSVLTDTSCCLASWNCGLLRFTVVLHCTLGFPVVVIPFKWFFHIVVLLAVVVTLFCGGLSLDYFGLDFHGFLDFSFDFPRSCWFELNFVPLYFLSFWLFQMSLRVVFRFFFRSEGLTFRSGCSVGFAFSLVIYHWVWVYNLCFAFVLTGLHWNVVVPLDLTSCWWFNILFVCCLWVTSVLMFCGCVRVMTLALILL